MPEDLDARFGELRALLQKPSWDWRDSDRVLALTQDACLEHPDLYDATWLPYLQGFPHHWEEPIGLLRRVEDLPGFARALPHARCWFLLDPDKLHDDELQALATSAHLGVIGELELAGEDWDIEAFRTLSGSPDWGRLRALRIGEGFYPSGRGDSFGTAFALALASARSMTQLRELDLWETTIGNEGFAALTQAAFFPQLTHLRCVGSVLGVASAEALASTWPQDLRHLTLSSNTLTNDGLAHLLGRPGAAKLEYLDVSMCWFGAEVAGLIATQAPNLHGLCLSGNEIGDAGARALAPLATHLKTLDVSRAQIGAEGARALLSQASRLTSLHLTGNPVGPPTGEMLSQAQARLRLERLGISSVGLGRHGTYALLQHGPWPALRDLRARNNGIEADALRALARAGFLDALERLDLSGNFISDEGARIIAEHANELTELSLRHCGIGDDGALALAQAPWMLTKLDLAGSQFGERGRLALASSPGLSAFQRRQFEEA